MDQFINSLPKPVIGLIVVIVGFIFIVINDPPKTICETQLQSFRHLQGTFIYGQSIDGSSKRPPLAQELHDLCLQENGTGGCFEYIQQLKRFTNDLKSLPRECSAVAASEQQIPYWLLKSLKLMAQIAWGERAPASYSRRHAWFDAADIAVFCDLRETAVRILGPDSFNKWRDDLIATLPEGASLSKEDAYRRSIFSTPCDAFR